MSETKLPIPTSKEPPKRNSLIGVRHFQFVFMFVTVLILFGMRTSLSVAIISMTAEEPPDEAIPTYPEWDNTHVILSSFFWGYIVPQVGAGQLSAYFGPKWFLVTTIIIGSVFNIVIPSMAAALGSTGVIICRVIQGLNQGFLFPSIHCLISKWTPLLERARISNYVYSGAALGIAVAMPITGAICGSTAGWPVAFYVYGGVGLGWAVVFSIFVENSPETHKRITVEEKMYIESTNAVVHDTNKKPPTPWVALFTSLPVWATLVAGIAQCWGSYTLLTEIPTYMNSIMNFDIKSNSQLSALPYVAQFFVNILGSPIADKLVEKKVLGMTAARKVFNGLATFLPAAALIYLAFIDSSQKNLAVVLLVIAVGAIACVFSGYMVNMIDIAPNHTATIVGLVNGTSNIFSILGPLSVGLFGDDKKDPLLWRTVFLVAAGIFVGCGTFYSLFASAEVQAWNEDESQKEEK